MVAAHGYRVQIQREDETNIFLNEGVSKAPETSFSDLPDGRYTVRLRGIDTNGLEGLNAQRDVIVKARPEPPFSQGPDDKGTVRADRPEFRWAQVAEAASYRFQLAKDPEFKSTLIDAPALTTTPLATDKPLPPGEYYWRVASRRESGDLGPFGDVQQFSLKAIPVVPNGVTPLVDNRLLTLRWKSGSPRQSYRFQRARNRDFDPTLTDAKLTEPEIQLPRPVGGTLFMRVQAIDSDGYRAEFSKPERVVLAEQYPNLESRQLEKDQPTFKWNAPLPGQKVRFQLARDEQFSSLVHEATLESNQLQIKNPGGGRYFIHVGLINRDSYTAPFGPAQKIDIPRNYWLLLLLLTLLLI